MVQLIRFTVLRLTWPPARSLRLRECDLICIPGTISLNAMLYHFYQMGQVSQVGHGSRLKTMNIAASQTAGGALHYANPNNPEP